MEHRELYVWVIRWTCVVQSCLKATVSVDTIAAVN